MLLLLGQKLGEFGALDALLRRVEGFALARRRALADAHVLVERARVELATADRARLQDFRLRICGKSVYIELTMRVGGTVARLERGGVTAIRGWVIRFYVRMWKRSEGGGIDGECFWDGS